MSRVRSATLIGPATSSNGRVPGRTAFPEKEPPIPTPLKSDPHPPTSTVVQKVVLAASGAALTGFVVAHLLGNLQVYAGRERLNAYAGTLHHAPALLWGTRVVLSIAVVSHVLTAWRLARRNDAARPIGYQVVVPRRSSYASRTMRWSGPILALFIAYHLLHLTVGALHASFDPEDVYGNVISGFQVWYVSGVYVVAMAALGLHLRHGLWSALQSIGLVHPFLDRNRDRLAVALSALIVAGNVSIPIAVLTGVIR